MNSKMLIVGAIGVLALITIVATLFVSGGLFSSTPLNVPVPNAVFSNSNIPGTQAWTNAGYDGCPSGKYTLTCMLGGAGAQSVTNNTYDYTITMVQGYCVSGYGCGAGSIFTQSAPATNLFIALDLNDSKYADAQDQASIAGLKSAQQQAISNAQAYQNQNSYENQGQAAANAYLGIVNGTIGILNAAISYNNALPVPECAYGPYNHTSFSCPTPSCPLGTQFNVTLNKCAAIVCTNGYTLNTQTNQCTQTTQPTTTISSTQPTTTVPACNNCVANEPWYQPVLNVWNAIVQFFSGLFKGL